MQRRGAWQMAGARWTSLQSARIRFVAIDLGSPVDGRLVDVGVMDSGAVDAERRPLLMWRLPRGPTGECDGRIVRFTTGEADGGVIHFAGPAT